MFIVCVSKFFKNPREKWGPVYIFKMNQMALSKSKIGHVGCL